MPFLCEETSTHFHRHTQLRKGRHGNPYSPDERVQLEKYTKYLISDWWANILGFDRTEINELLSQGQNVVMLFLLE